MQQVFILVMLAGVTHAFFPAAETKCNATQNTSQCSATLGGAVYIQLMTSASGHQLRCKKELSTGPLIVFSLKRETVTVPEPFRNRTQFFIHNGTMKITNVEVNDSGAYSVEIFTQDGVLVRNVKFTLDVEESILANLIIICSAAGGLLILILVVICCCVCRKVRRRKKSGSKKKSERHSTGLY